MPTHASFRFSTYLTLAIACIAVGMAEHDILPEVGVFAALAVLGLGVLYFLETRVSLLSIPSANRLGGIIIGIYVLWAAYRIKRAISYNEFFNMGWQTFIVALCGPLVMVTIVAKVARRDKHAGDYWTLQGIALAGIGMSAAFAEETSSFVIVGFYLVAAVWSLALLYLGRASGVVPAIPGGRLPATKALAVSKDPTGHRIDLLPANVWAALALLVAIPLYLLTPRSQELKVDFGKPRIEVGYSADQMVDLNQAGPLATNSEVAFEFTATNEDGTPKTDMDPNQRWRGKTFRHYLNGEWKASEEVLPHIAYARGEWQPGERLQARRMDEWAEPKLGPGQFKITYDVPAKLRTTFLADPVVWAADQPPPLAYLPEKGAPRAFLPVADGTFYFDFSIRQRGTPRRYVQIYRNTDPPDTSPPFRFVPPDYQFNLSPLRQNPVPRVTQYANTVLQDLIKTGKLPKDCCGESEKDKDGGVSLLPKPQYHEAVAREFTAYLSHAPGFTYTTDLRRENLKIDPVEEFLFATKEGHCERFAAALALMLRSQGIHCVYVLGFKGCEHTEEGKYLVRQEHAHAWVEALVPKAGEPYDPNEPLKNVHHWVSLDPTPGGQETAAEVRPWWTQANSWIQTRFQEYVKDYTPEQRRKAIAGFIEQLSRPASLAIIGLGGLLLIGGRYGLRRLQRRPADALPPVETSRWFAELLTLLAAHGIAPARGETLLEFANSATGALRERGLAGVAGVPLEWVRAYYQDRFGGTPPSDARLAELEGQLDLLRQALVNRGT